MDDAINFCRAVISVFRAEERRKVESFIMNIIDVYLCYNGQLLSLHPYEDYANFSNSKVASKIMRSMRAELDPQTVHSYERNVSLLVCHFNWLSALCQ